MEQYINLSRFFDGLKSLTFWKRLFSWNTFLSLGYDAYQEFRKLMDATQESKIQNDSLLHQVELQKAELDSLNKQIQDSRNLLTKLESRDQNQQAEIKRFESDYRTAQNKLLELEQSEVHRLREYEGRIQRMEQIKESFEREKQRLADDRLREAEQKMAKMKETWILHEENVKLRMKAICQKETIDYVEQVPFKGRPDNTISICNEYVVFDAKSPAGDDLGNFFSYIKNQVDAAKKYVGQENVRKDIYLVVPSNTVEVIKQFSFNMGSYNAYIITADALEPVLLSLKKIEEYEFAEKLSPEDRESICRVIGSLLYASKRKIQVDQFFNSRLLETISHIRQNLPEQLVNEVVAYEKAEIINPPTDRRAKEISMLSLRENGELLGAQAELYDIPKAQLVEVIN
ncbi:MAG: hypothetical protein M9954_13385 [Cyclobacteriaceae bacterium]|nr:hypothetical protein [Cyclobacteriaceae bacterium]